MNRLEYILSKIQEESSEIAQIAAKTQQYGLDSFNPFDESMTTNLDLLKGEFNDLIAVMVVLNQELKNMGEEMLDTDDKHIRRKTEKLRNIISERATNE